MGRRGGKKCGGNDEGGGFSDQYGEAMQSQDRGERPNFSSKSGGGFTGGGEAGSAGRGPDLKVNAHVPAFLRQHAHFLHNPKGVRQEEPTIDDRGGDDSGSDFEGDDGGALARAIAENPALAAQDSRLQQRANKARAEEEKAAGNRAFGAKEFDKAVDHFTTCIRLDPESEVYYSNRSAAHMGQGKHREALADGKKVVDLRPAWTKGWARVGAAFFALEQFSEAREAYRKALDIEPEDAQLQEALHRSEVQERNSIEQRKHKFAPHRGAPTAASSPAKRQRLGGGDKARDDGTRSAGGGGGGSGYAEAGGASSKSGSKSKPGKVLLSFDDG